MGSLLRLGSSFVVCLALLTGCSRKAEPVRNREVPARLVKDPGWGDWWPSAQWSRECSPPDEAELRGASRAWDAIVFPDIETPWGTAYASMARIQVSPPFPPRHGIRFDLVWSRPNPTLNKEAWDKFPTPEKGDVQAEIVSEGQVLRSPVNGEPEILVWAGGSLGVSGDMKIEFDWLPSDLRDYWIRVAMKESTCWFLIPYGFGSDPSGPLNVISDSRGAPTRPSGAGPRDQLLFWSHVEFKLGWLDLEGKIRTDLPEKREEFGRWEINKRRVTVRYSNPDRVLILSHGGEGTGLVRPRTAVTLGIPGDRILFARLREVESCDPGHRSDRFDIPRPPRTERAWGILRVTVEEAVFERALPGSLFLAGHGGSD